MKLTKAHLIHIAKQISTNNIELERAVHEDVNADRKVHQRYVSMFLTNIITATAWSNKWQNEKVQAEIERIVLPLTNEMKEYRDWNHPFHVRNKLIKNLCIALSAQNPKFDAEKFKSACLKGK